jgi:hypothetical protein
MNFTDMTKKELVAWADRHGIKVDPADTKAVLIAAVATYGEPAEVAAVPSVPVFTLVQTPDGLGFVTARRPSVVEVPSEVEPAVVETREVEPLWQVTLLGGGTIVMDTEPQPVSIGQF